MPWRSTTTSPRASHPTRSYPLEGNNRPDDLPPACAKRVGRRHECTPETANSKSGEDMTMFTGTSIVPLAAILVGFLGAASASNAVPAARQYGWGNCGIGDHAGGMTGGTE